MPELPEVETTVRGVRPVVAGRQIRAVVVRERRLRWPVSRGLNRTLKGKHVTSVARRAKYILLNFSHGSVMIHLGMSGRLRVVPADTPLVKHDHVDFVLDSGKVLRFHDPRRFGSILWVSQDFTNSPLIKNLGPEPFDEALTGATLYRLSRGRKTRIKQFIMDGRIIVGVGNIYASEALFRAGIRPGRAAGRVTLPRFEQLLDAIRQVLSEAIKAGGTTLRDYSRVTGEPGYFEQSLDVYERAGSPCVNCAVLIRRKVIGQRASYYCPSCQN
ncbi:MAG: DNA-formamidopyrimidine glycosylase [Acidiferrobacteraceae bacterium]|nr:DNA-formamidopyrimidine glycosylase [Acidiferrobacteraceae bacterium]MDP6792124.1 bifunctional DNA-formamidopyrimidine glycosylase/DNA-(apurinic or apyrimidinic site) lyase [Arenicellales bacterium]MDP6919873.1 bifunctional DNA-formamidopyrimidine glycosylase/DNA-(apurinic or apyrimidinic site) lyase [Arenicellales bacterium]